MSEERLDRIREDHLNHNDLDNCDLCLLIDTIERLTPPKAPKTYSKHRFLACPACGAMVSARSWTRLCGRCAEAGFEALDLFANRAIGDISEGTQ